MNLADFPTLLNLGIEVDFRERTYTIKLGPITLKNLSFETVQALSSNQGAIDSLLSKCFVQRGVMWQDFTKETVDKCIRSLRELQNLLEEQASSFDATVHGEDQFPSSLRAWANECDGAARLLVLAVEDEGDPINTGMDIRAEDSIPDALGGLRKSMYPFIEFLIDLLPDKDQVKDQAAARLREGKNILVRVFGISVSELVSPDLEIDPI